MNLSGNPRRASASVAAVFVLGGALPIAWALAFAAAHAAGSGSGARGSTALVDAEAPLLGDAAVTTWALATVILVLALLVVARRPAPRGSRP